MPLRFSELDEHLVVGSAPHHEDDVAALADRGVTAVVCLQTDADLRERGLLWEVLWRLWVARGVATTRIPIVDFDKRDLLRNLDAACEAIQAHRAVGARVYVHCSAGLNRSPSAVIAWLAVHRNMSLEAALRWLDARHEAVPYRDVLTQWAKRRRLALEG